MTMTTEFRRDYLAEIEADMRAQDLPNPATVLRAIAERNELRAINTALVAALDDIVADIDRGGCPVRGSVMHEAARAALAKVRAVAI